LERDEEKYSRTGRQMFDAAMKQMQRRDCSLWSEHLGQTIGVLNICNIQFAICHRVCTYHIVPTYVAGLRCIPVSILET